MQTQFTRAFAFAFRFGVLVALPLVLLALGGRFLDRHFGTEPWFLLGGIALSLVLTPLIAAKEVREILEPVNPAQEGEAKQPPRKVSRG